MFLGIADGIHDDRMRIEDHLELVGSIDRYQTAAGQVGLISQLVAGKDKDLGCVALTEGFDPAGLTNTRLAQKHGNQAGFDVGVDQLHESVIEFHSTVLSRIFRFF